MTNKEVMEPMELEDPKSGDPHLLLSGLRAK